MGLWECKVVPSSQGDTKQGEREQRILWLNILPSRGVQSQMASLTYLEMLTFAGIPSTSESSYKHRMLFSVSPMPLIHTAQRTLQTAHVCLKLLRRDSMETKRLPQS